MSNISAATRPHHGPRRHHPPEYGSTRGGGGAGPERLVRADSALRWQQCELLLKDGASTWVQSPVTTIACKKGGRDS